MRLNSSTPAKLVAKRSLIWSGRRCSKLERFAQVTEQKQLLCQELCYFDIKPSSDGEGCQSITYPIHVRNCYAATQVAADSGSIITKIYATLGYRTREPGVSGPRQLRNHEQMGNPGSVFHRLIDGLDRPAVASQIVEGQPWLFEACGLIFFSTDARLEWEGVHPAWRERCRQPGFRCVAQGEWRVWQCP